MATNTAIKNLSSVVDSDIVVSILQGDQGQQVFANTSLRGHERDLLQYARKLIRRKEAENDYVDTPVEKLLEDLFAGSGVFQGVTIVFSNYNDGTRLSLKS